MRGCIRVTTVRRNAVGPSMDNIFTFFSRSDKIISQRAVSFWTSTRLSTSTFFFGSLLMRTEAPPSFRLALMSTTKVNTKKFQHSYEQYY